MRTRELASGLPATDLEQTLRHQTHRRGVGGNAASFTVEASLDRTRTGVEVASRLVASTTAEEVAQVLQSLVEGHVSASACVFLGDAEQGVYPIGLLLDEDDERLRLARVAARAGRVQIVPTPAVPGSHDPVPLVATPIATASRTFGAVVAGDAAQPDQLALLTSLATLAATVIEQREHSETKAAEARLDALTGLANKRAFHEHLAVLLEAATAEAPVSLVLFDVDNFKQINDREGHVVGDRVLRKVARVSLAALRVGEEIFRLGGEEFAVLVHGDKKGAERVANRIRNGLSAQRRELSLPTISGGVATAPIDGLTADELLHKADVALYIAKERGKDRVVSYRPAVDAGPHSEREEREQQLEADWWLKVLGMTARARGEDDSGPGWLPQDVARVCDLVGLELGIPDQEREPIVLAAVLTELCKLTLPDSIRNKATALTTRDWKLLHGRTERLIAALSPIPHLAAATPILAACRERWDGRGHPVQLRGRAIPIGSRIVAVCEAFCALTAPRSYRPARTQARALLELQELSGSRFDPVCVAALHAVAERGGLVSASSIQAAV